MDMNHVYKKGKSFPLPHGILKYFTIYRCKNIDSNNFSMGLFLSSQKCWKAFKGITIIKCI